MSNSNGLPAKKVRSAIPCACGANQLLRDANMMDNELEHTVNVFSRPTRTLILAGGPMRDYRFARTMLYRHPSIKSDVWLQSAPSGVSQDADELLYEFPDRTALFEYDVILAFDVNWELLSPEQMQTLNEWVATGGGRYRIGCRRCQHTQTRAGRRKVPADP